MKTQTRVIEIKQPPTLDNPAILQGIRDVRSAQAWGEKNGYTIVYFIHRKQKVYAERVMRRRQQRMEQMEMGL